MAHGDGDATEVLGGQATLIGQGTDDGTGTDVLALAHIKAVGNKVTVRTTRAAITTVTAAAEATAVAVATVVALKAVTVAAVTLGLRLLLEQELLAALQLHGECGGNVVHGHIIGLRVRAHEAAEDLHLLVLEGLADRRRELLLALRVDLVNAGQIHFLEASIGHALNRTEHATLTRGDEEDGLARAAGTTGTADAVDVGLRVIRNVVVDDVRDAVDVQATGRDVCRNEDVQAAILELVDGALTLLLRDVAVNGGRVVAGVAQGVCDLFGLVLRAAEDNHAVVFDDLKDARERVHLLAVCREQVALRDVVIRAALGLDGNLSRVIQVLLGQTADAVGHGRGEEGDLLFVRGVL